MPASTFQLVSYGAQDMYLTGNPQITYFKVVYRRHTNFSMEDLVIDTLVNGQYGTGTSRSFLIPKMGDLFHKISLLFKGNKVYQGHFLANPTTELIDHVKIVVDGHQIDKQHGHWIETWYELTKPNNNGTCSNLTYINDHSLTHLSSSMDLALCHYDRHSIGNTLVSASDVNSLIPGAVNGSMVAMFISDTDHYHTYYNNRLNKLTNIMGLGLSYPPTQFQKQSKCGGVFCSPSFLQENISKGGEFNSASYVDYAITDVSIVGDKDTNFNGSGTLNASNTRNGGSNASGIVSSTNIGHSMNSGSILGNCILDIPFWFSKDPGLSIPIVALQNSNIQFEIKFVDQGIANLSSTSLNANYSYNGPVSNLNNCFNCHKTGPAGSTFLKPLLTGDNKFNFDIDVLGLFIYLDVDEKRRFAQVSHEYLIEQVQHANKIGGTSNTNNTNIKINFSHPVKELIWTGSPFNKSDIDGTSASGSDGDISSDLNTGKKSHNSGVRFQQGNDSNIPGGSINSVSAATGFGSASDSFTNILTDTPGNGIFKAGLIGPSTPSWLDECDWSIEFNGQTRIGPYNLQYYTRTQVERHHTGHGSVSCPDSIAVYSFALKPEEHQPSGTCNFSKIDNVTIKRDMESSNNNLRSINVYAVNYNILRIMGGMCSLAYNL